MKKSMKKIIPAFLMLGVAASMMATSSYAWFSMSREANVEGMELQAKADSSLVIGTSYVVADQTSVSFASEEHKLIPSTYVENVSSPTPADGVGSLSKYITVANTEEIDPSTGSAFGNDSDLRWTNAVAGTHYFDYVVYIASAGTSMTGTLKAKVTFDDADHNLKFEQKATTVDFFTKEANSQVSFDATTTRQTSVNTTNADSTYTVASGLVLPVNTDDSVSNLYRSIAVCMRVYIDGALKESGNNCYVKSSQVDLSKVNISVAFSFVANPGA